MPNSVEAGHGLWELSAEAITAWATVGAVLFAAVTAFIAFGGAWIALRQMKEAREAGKRDDAQESYRSYLETAVKYPELASPDYATLRADPLNLEQYNWFVSYLLAASEKILEIAGKESEWVNTIKLNIGYHSELFLDKAHFEDQQLACYDISLRKLIFEVAGRRLPKDDCREWARDKEPTARAAQ